MKRRSLRSLTKKEALNATTCIIKVAETEASESRTSTEPNMIQKERVRKNIRETELFDEVKESIHNTFSEITPRVYRQVKELTSSILDEKQEIERLCKKYSIIKRFKKSSFENVQVDANQIAKQFIKNRENEQHKKDEKARIRKEILSQPRFSAAKEYKKSEQFFSFTGNHLKDWEKQESKNKHKKSLSADFKKAHPYLKIYQQSEREALAKIGLLETIELCGELPEFPEPEEWEENAHHSIQRTHMESQLQRRKIYNSRRNIEQRANPKYFFK